MTGILIPLYTYPTDGTWHHVSVQKILKPEVPMIAVINPNNGPGYGLDPNYVAGVNVLQAAGVTVLGYVATGYGGRSTGDLVDEANRYIDWYQVNGIFWDEYESGWVPPVKVGTDIGNPGTGASGPIPLITYEDPGMPPAGFTGNYIAYAVPTLPAQFPRPDWLYITNDSGANPYDSLPTYFASLVAAVALGQTSGTSPPPPGKILKLTLPDGTSYSWSVT